MAATARAALPSFNSFNAGNFTNDGTTISLKQPVVGTFTGNGSGLTNIAGVQSFVAAGTNVTVVTNGSVYTVSGSAVGGISAAAGSGIAASTNGSVVTFSTNGQTVSWPGQVQWPLSAITNAGTAAYSNSASFQPANANLTNWSGLATNRLADLTNSLGTAAYADTNQFLAGSNGVTGTVVVPSTGATNTSVTFKRFIASPSSGSENYPLVLQLLTNQNFVIQDELGNNIFGIRHDTYGAGAGKKWLLAFGSKQQGMIDQIFDLSSGADFTWRINGDLKNTFQMQTYSQGIGFRFIYNNTNYNVDEVDCPLLDNYGTVRPTSIVGLPIHLTQTATIGAGAGSGGSVGVTVDNNATDIGAVITLTTGHTATAAGTIFTYSPANDVGQFDAGVTALQYRPTLTATNANALGVMNAVYAVGGTAAIAVKSTVPLPIDTVYAFALFLHR